MQNVGPDWQVEHSGLTDVRAEFRENKVLVTERINYIQQQLKQHYDRLTQIENDLKLKTNRDELEPRDARMTRIENDLKSFIKLWIGVTVPVTIGLFTAIFAAVKLFS